MADGDKSKPALEYTVTVHTGLLEHRTLSNTLIKYCYFLICIQESHRIANYKCTYHLLVFAEFHTLTKLFQIVSHLFLSIILQLRPLCVVLRSLFIEHKLFEVLK